MWSDDEFLKKHGTWMLVTHMYSLATVVAVAVVAVQLVVAIVKEGLGGGGDGGGSVAGWLFAFAFLVIIPGAVVLFGLPMNAYLYFLVLRSALHRRRTDPESYRTVVVPALEETRGVPRILMRLYRRVGMDPLKRV